MLTIDLHNHTIFSYDGTNTPEEIIENAIAHNIDIIGISDHQFTIGPDLSEYISRINKCKELYKGKIKVLCGLEISTDPPPNGFDVRVTDVLDYVMFERLDREKAMPFDEFLNWQNSFKCKKGLAHTDIFKLGELHNVDMLELMKNNGLFWEINISGNYNYYYDFLSNEKKRIAVRNSGITLSIGSDTHWIEEYRFRQIRRANELVRELGNPILFGKDNL